MHTLCCVVLYTLRYDCVIQYSVYKYSVYIVYILYAGISNTGITPLRVAVPKAKIAGFRRVLSTSFYKDSGAVLVISIPSQ